ncbi:lipopolysaccharide biosynthesis protein [Ekhidna sp. MALMAid0563]|uniref:lipopolysaccharide biosynthesis protein n=1 Tax=Ekhidna sp. MALMAid0563 TaxID=3143937 RepID=UPI0032DFADCB
MIKRGIIWDFVGKISAFTIRLIVTVFLTRLLAPEDFGIYGIIFFFTALVQGFSELGFSAGLIQKQTISEELKSSVFWLNVLTSVFLFLVIYFSAPLIGSFYGNKELVPLCRILGIILLIGSFKIVQQALYIRTLDFKTQSILSSFSVLISGVVAIGFAYNNYGVWSLIIYELAGAMVLTILFWIKSPWRPSYHFSIKDLKQIWGFSSMKLSTIIINTIFTRLDYLIISKFFPLNTMGLYTRAKSLTQYVNQFSSGSLATVLFPAFSQKQNKKGEVERLYQKSLKTVCFFSLLLSGSLYLIADQVFVFFFGKEWELSAEYFELMALNGYVFPVSAIMVNLILGLGYAGKNFKIGLIKKVLATIALVLAILFGIKAYLIGMLFHGFISIIINVLITSSILGITIKQHLSWFMPLVVVGYIMIFLSSSLVLLSDSFYMNIASCLSFIALFTIYVLMTDSIIREQAHYYYGRLFKKSYIK